MQQRRSNVTSKGFLPGGCLSKGRCAFATAVPKWPIRWDSPKRVPELPDRHRDVAEQGQSNAEHARGQNDKIKVQESLDARRSRRRKKNRINDEWGDERDGQRETRKTGRAGR
jgi:hypothetical protein